MVNNDKIQKLQGLIKRNKEMLSMENDLKVREKLKLKIQIDELKIKIEKSN